MKTHYLAREPAIALPFLALAVNILLIVGVAYSLHYSGKPAQITVFSRVDTDTMDPHVPVLEIHNPGDFVFQAQAFSNLDDLKFKLSAVASNGTAILIKVAPGLDTQYLINLLEICNRSGYTDIALHAATKEDDRPSVQRAAR